MIEKLFEEKDTVTQNGHETSDKIRSYFEKVREVLRERESALCSTVQKYTDIRLSRIDTNYQMLENHHCTILTRIGDIESLIDSSDSIKIFREKQSSSEDLEKQLQSIMSLSDILEESCRKGSLLFQDGPNTTTFNDLGTLKERIQEDDSPFFTLRRIIVSEEEDPYLDVPLRFEDEESAKHPQKQMRYDERQQIEEYELENKPTFDIYSDVSDVNVANNVQTDDHLMLTNNPPVPRRKLSILTGNPPVREKFLTAQHHHFSDTKKEVAPRLKSQSDTDLVRHYSLPKLNEHQHTPLEATGYDGIPNNPSRTGFKFRTCSENIQSIVFLSDSDEVSVCVC